MVAASQADSASNGLVLHLVLVPCLEPPPFCFPTQPRPLIVFVDGRVHLGKTQMFKDEELRTLLRKKGYGVLELFYNGYSQKKRDELYHRIRESIGK